MSNDDRPSSGKSTQAAQQNKISHRDRKHPWHLPYLKTCIIKNCRTKPYYDGSTYFTCCLSCLREKELGPFYKTKNPRLHGAEAKFKAVHRTVEQEATKSPPLVLNCRLRTTSLLIDLLMSRLCHCLHETYPQCP
jgi:hypothetical protein